MYMAEIKQVVDIVTKRFLAAGCIIHIPIYPDDYDLNVNLIGKWNKHPYIIAVCYNETDDLAEAMAHLYEAQYREGFEYPTLIIALTDSLSRSRQWLKDYYENGRDIRLIWLDEENQLQATKYTQQILDFLWSGAVMP
jgi:hypothetical protein